MKPILILDQHFRRLEELFRPETFDELSALCDVHDGQNWPMPRDRIEALLPDARFYVAARPELDADDLAAAPNLQATIEVSGAFRDGLDYTACVDRGVEVLSCSPGFRRSVAEMTLGMMLAGARGLVAEHEAFRRGAERWLDDREDTDFSLHDAPIGFIGYGQISRETHRLLAPFGPHVMAYDPLLVDAGPDVDLCDLETLVAESRVVVMAAVPSETTRGLLSAELISRLQPGALVIVISRAWSVDFPALMAAADSGKILVATDVFPDEPVHPSDPVRQARNVILSPHRAAAVAGGRHLIGDMILHDVKAMMEGRAERQLKSVDPTSVASLVAAQQGIGGMAKT
ncbi:MAG: NAD(P)-dependent oxidoreductase [Pseudomonadota bacterium]